MTDASQSPNQADRPEGPAAGPLPAVRSGAGALGVVLAIAAALIVVRGIVCALFPQAHFDSDQAVTGLMALHLSQGRAFPLFYYGQHYMLAVEAWLAAPLFWLAGHASVPLLKLPLLGLNVAAGALLIVSLVRSCRLSPWLAGLVSLFFVLAPPVTSSRLVEAQGGNIEPFVYVLAIWLLRHRPIAAGAVAAFGFLNREFALYGVVALLVTEAFERRLFSRVNLGDKLAMAASFAATWSAIYALKPFADPLGPGTSAGGHGTATTSLAPLAERLSYINVREWPGNVHWLVTDTLPTIFGARRGPLSEWMSAPGPAGAPWLWPLLAATGLVVVLRLAWIRMGGRAGASHSPDAALRERLALPVYLIAVGAISALAYVTVAVDVRGPVLIRYTLLSLLTPVGLAAWLFVRDGGRAWRAAVGLSICVWAGASLVRHVEVAFDYARHAPVDAFGQLSGQLEARGVRYGWGDYWTAYRFTFLTNERMVFASTDKVRVAAYQRLVEANGASAVEVSRIGGDCQERIAQWFVCPSQR